MSRPFQRRLVGVAAAMAALAIAPASAHAQMLVYDATSFGKLVEQAQTALTQLDQLKQQVAQGQRLFDSLNQISNVNAIASQLASPTLRAFLPDADKFVAAAKGDLGALGQIGQTALAIRSSNRLYTPADGDVVGADLEAAGNRTARDLATAQAVGEAGAARLTGLQQLQGALDTAPNARAVLDIQARISAEQAMIANDQMRLQGLAMSQDAEARLAEQRARERAAAAAAARLALYRSGFQ
jgi:type IV secretion system protein VirB5